MFSVVLILGISKKNFVERIGRERLDAYSRKIMDPNGNDFHSGSIKIYFFDSSFRCSTRKSIKIMQ
jgi:hypothetical protein